MKVEPTCPNCGSKNIFKQTEGISGNGHFSLLPGLGGFLYYAKIYPVMCQDCGLVRFFAGDDATSKVEESAKWERV